MSKKMPATTKLLVLLVSVSWLMGCASGGRSRPEPAEYCMVDNSVQFAGIRRVALVADAEPPTIEAASLGNTHGEGVTEGAAAGAAAGAAFAANISLSGDPSAMLAGVLLSPVLVTGGAVGGAVAGGVAGYSPEQLAEAEANARAMLEPTIFQTEFLKRTHDYGNASIDLEFSEIPSVTLESRPDDQTRKGLASQSVDAVLEVGLVRIKLDRISKLGIRHRLVLDMEARSRLVSAGTNDALSENRHAFRSSPRSLEEWTGNGAVRLSEEIQTGFQKLAEDVVHDNFALLPREKHGNRAEADSENPAGKDVAANNIFFKAYSAKPGTRFSPVLLEIPEGKSALVIYRTAYMGFDDELTYPVLINSKFLSTLPADSFDCLIVEPGTYTVTYPSRPAPARSFLLNDEDYARIYDEIRITTASAETRDNEILYFRMKYTSVFLSQGVSGEFVSEKEAMHHLGKLRRAKMQVLWRD